MLLRNLFEDIGPVADAAFAFGRFNPAHQGHIEVYKTVQNAGRKWYIGTNPSTQGPNDPLSFEQKSAWMQAIYPAIQGHLLPQQSVVTLASKLYELLPEGSTIAYVTDSKDWEWAGKLLNDYNGKEGPHGYYKFKAIKHVESPRVSSATALRTAARAGDEAAFYAASGTDPKLTVGGKTYFETVVDAVGAHPEKVKKVAKKKEPAATEGKKPEHNLGVGWMLDKDKKLGQKVAQNKARARQERQTMLKYAGKKDVTESLGTMPTTEYVKGIYAAAAENGMGAPDVEAVRKQMVLAANGEVDIMATMQKALRVFQDPKFKQMLADLDALIKKAESGQGVAEVSKSTLDRYVTKAVDAHGHADFAARQSKNDPSKRSYHVDQKKTAEKRRQGISRALDRMSKEGVAEADMNRRGFLKGLGAAALGGAGVGAAQAGIGADLAGAAARGLYYGTTSRVAGSAIHKEKNAADIAFADKIPDEWDRTRYLKAVKSVIRSRDDSVMRYAGHDGSASRGSIIVAERKFNRIKTELSQKYNIPLDPVKEQSVAEGSKVKTAKGYGDVVQGTDVKTVAKADLGKNKLNLPKGYGDIVQPQKLKTIAKAKGVAEGGSNAMADTAKRLANKDDGKVAKLRAAGDKRREEELKGRNIAKRNESVDLKTSLQELSNDMLGRYKKAAGADASKADKEGNVKRGDKRFSGIVKATNKQFANDAKKTK